MVRDPVQLNPSQPNGVGRKTPSPDHVLPAGSLSEYLRHSREYNETAYQQPRYKHPYRTSMWEFVRRAKAHSDLEHLEGFEAASLVERCMESWPEASAGHDLWRDCFPGSDDAKTEFIDTWGRIKWPRTELDRAQAEAARLPLKPLLCSSRKYAQFISIAGHLQRGVDGPILLPCNKFSQFLDCTPMAVSRYRRLAQQCGLLKLDRKGSKLQRQADEFSFVVELFDWKTGDQIPTENVNVLSAHSTGCYTEIQEKQEIERKPESQEKQESKDTQEMQRETKSKLPPKRKCAIRQGPYIPTTAELERALEKTAHLRAR